MELNNTLDHKIGGEITSQLEQLYMFMTERLTQANAKGDAQCLRDVIKILEILYQGWNEAIQKLKKEEAKP
jgi:flagellar secretion chaperone FliS